MGRPWRGEAVYPDLREFEQVAIFPISAKLRPMERCSAHCIYQPSHQYLRSCLVLLYEIGARYFQLMKYGCVKVDLRGGG